MNNFWNKTSVIGSTLLMSLLAQGDILLQLPCDNSPAERQYIVEDSSFFDMGLTCRITDSTRKVIYKFDTPNARVESIKLRIGNSYRISLSRDGENWQTFAVVDKQYGGLSNAGEITIDTAEFLAGAESFYLKSEHFAPDKHPGFGGCLFSILLEGEGTFSNMHPAFYAPRRDAGSVNVDGVLDEKAWQTASWTGNFSMYNTTETPSQPTYTAVIYDDENIYFGFKCYDIRIGNLEAIATTRDGNIFSDNVVEIFLQPGGDVNTPYWHLAANPASIQFDGIVTVGDPVTGYNDDRSWDIKWECPTSKHPDRWEMEIAVPWSELGVTPEEGDVFFANFTRNAGAFGEMTSMVPIAGTYHSPERFARMTLTGNREFNSFGINHRMLNGNPPVFEFLTQAGTAPADYSSQAVIDFYTANRALEPVSSEPMYSKVIDSSLAGAATLFDTPLLPGYYLVSIDWKQNGVSAYKQLSAVLMPAEDREALKIEMVQPIYQNEDNVRVICNSRIKPAVEDFEWAVADRDGNILYSGTAAPDEENIINIPVPEEDGDYSVMIQAPGMPDTLRSAEFRKEAVIGEPTVFTVTPEGNWLKNGEEFFPLIACLAGGSEEVKDAGFNFIIVGSDGDGSDEAIAANIELLDAAAEHDLYVMLHLCNLFRGKEDYEGLKRLVSALKNHPALGAWYIADEPSGTATSPKTLRKAAEVIRAIDTDHPISGCDNSPLMFESFNGIFDAWLPDPYPVPHNSLVEVTHWLERSYKVMDDNVSMVPYLQSFGPPFISREPTPEEIRNMTLQALACGVQGMAWWAYGPIVSSPNKELYFQMVQNCREVAPLIYGIMPERVQEGNVYFAKYDSPRGTVVIAVNTANEPVKAVLPWDAPAEEMPFGSGVTRSGKELEFAPHGCALWK